jgi:hypothetical protein
MRRRAARARSIRSLRWSSLYVTLVFLEVACSADVKRPGELLSGRAAIDIVFSDVSEVLSKSRAQSVPLNRF